MKVIICGAGQVGWQIARHLASEQNARRQQARMIGREMLRLEEKPDPPAALFADGRHLPRIGGAGEQDIRLRAFRCDPDPTLAAAEIRVLAALEADAAEERQRLVVIGDEQRKECNT